jgi:prepilin-type N-terminal cleavage/methylation domain-containing protein
MKYFPKKNRDARGFTLAELMVAMTITLVLVLLTLVITGTAIDAWKAARTEIRAAGQAKIMLNALGRDLESMVSRMGNNNIQWLIATSTSGQIGPAAEESPNAVQLTFFTSASDRYNGNAGSREKLDGNGPNRNADIGGDISAVSYQLDFVDPVFGSQNNRFATFVLYRNLLNPDETYAGVSGEQNLEQAFQNRAGANELDDLMCENVFEFTVTFVVTYRDVDGQTKTTKFPVMASNPPGGAQEVNNSFAINGTGLAPNQNTSSQYRGGRIAAVEISITVLTDEGIAILKRSPFRNDNERALFIEKNGYRYSRSVTVPQG